MQTLRFLSLTPLHAALCACLAGLAGSASAQSSVTLYGVMDVGVRHVNNEGRGSMLTVVSGSNSTSRFGLRGVEKLDATLSAGFQLESGVLADSGASASSAMLFDRAAYVFVTGPMGQIRLGRDFVPTYLNWSRYDPFSYVGIGGSTLLVANSQTGPIRSAFGTGQNTLVRSNNAIQYLLPTTLGGLEGGLMYAPREGGTAANGFGGLASARLGYATKSWNVSAASASTSNDLTAGSRFKDSAIAGSYNFGVVRVSAAWRQFKVSNAKQTNVLISGVIPVKTGEIKLAYQIADMDGKVGNTVIDNNGAKQLALGYVHNLSKRTAMYATYSRIDNQGTSTFALPGGLTGLAGGKSSSGLEIGLRHTF